MRPTRLAHWRQVSLAQVEALVAQGLPDFAEVLRRFGSPPIRSTATLAGNIANGSPIGDTMPCLLALGATLHLRRGDKTRTVALDKFYTGQKKTVLQPGEFIEAVSCPNPKPQARPSAPTRSASGLSRTFLPLAALSFRTGGGQAEAT
jgi:xanthine dehydrogenase iron-sulfur cluster and FAD-binding subunit A